MATSTPSHRLNLALAIDTSYNGLGSDTFDPSSPILLSPTGSTQKLIKDGKIRECFVQLEQLERKHSILDEFTPSVSSDEELPDPELHKRYETIEEYDHNANKEIRNRENGRKSLPVSKGYHGMVQDDGKTKDNGYKKKRKKTVNKFASRPSSVTESVTRQNRNDNSHVPNGLSGSVQHTCGLTQECRYKQKSDVGKRKRHDKDVASTLPSAKRSKQEQPSGFASRPPRTLPMSNSNSKEHVTFPQAPKHIKGCKKHENRLDLSRDNEQLKVNEHLPDDNLCHKHKMAKSMENENEVSILAIHVAPSQPHLDGCDRGTMDEIFQTKPAFNESITIPSEYSGQRVTDNDELALDKSPDYMTSYDSGYQEEITSETEAAVAALIGMSKKKNIVLNKQVPVSREIEDENVGMQYSLDALTQAVECAMEQERCSNEELQRATTDVVTHRGLDTDDNSRGEFGNDKDVEYHVDTMPIQTSESVDTINDLQTDIPIPVLMKETPQNEATCSEKPSLLSNDTQLSDDQDIPQIVNEDPTPHERQTECIAPFSIQSASGNLSNQTDNQPIEEPRLILDSETGVLTTTDGVVCNQTCEVDSNGYDSQDTKQITNRAKSDAILQISANLTTNEGTEESVETTTEEILENPCGENLGELSVAVHPVSSLSISSAIDETSHRPQIPCGNKDDQNSFEKPHKTNPSKESVEDGLNDEGHEKQENMKPNNDEANTATPADNSPKSTNDVLYWAVKPSDAPPQITPYVQVSHSRTDVRKNSSELQDKVEMQCNATAKARLNNIISSLGKKVLEEKATSIQELDKLSDTNADDDTNPDRVSNDGNKEESTTDGEGTSKDEICEEQSGDLKQSNEEGLDKEENVSGGEISTGDASSNQVSQQDVLHADDSHKRVQSTPEMNVQSIPEMNIKDDEKTNPKCAPISTTSLTIVSQTEADQHKAIGSSSQVTVTSPSSLTHPQVIPQHTPYIQLTKPWDRNESPLVGTDVIRKLLNKPPPPPYSETQRNQGIQQGAQRPGHHVPPRRPSISNRVVTLPDGRSILVSFDEKGTPHLPSIDLQSTAGNITLPSSPPNLPRLPGPHRGGATVSQSPQQFSGPHVAGLPGGNPAVPTQQPAVHNQGTSPAINVYPNQLPQPQQPSTIHFPPPLVSPVKKETAISQVLELSRMYLQTLSTQHGRQAVISDIERLERLSRESNKVPNVPNIPINNPGNLPTGFDIAAANGEALNSQLQKLNGQEVNTISSNAENLDLLNQIAAVEIQRLQQMQKEQELRQQMIALEQQKERMRLQQIAQTRQQHIQEMGKVKRFGRGKKRGPNLASGDLNEQEMLLQQLRQQHAQVYENHHPPIRAAVQEANIPPTNFKQRPSRTNTDLGLYVKQKIIEKHMRGMQHHSKMNRHHQQQNVQPHIAQHTPSINQFLPEPLLQAMKLQNNQTNPANLQPQGAHHVGQQPFNQIPLEQLVKQQFHGNQTQSVTIGQPQMQNNATQQLGSQIPVEQLVKQQLMGTQSSQSSQEDQQQKQHAMHIQRQMQIQHQRKLMMQQNSTTVRKRLKELKTQPLYVDVGPSPQSHISNDTKNDPSLPRIVDVKSMYNKDAIPEHLRLNSQVLPNNAEQQHLLKIADQQRFVKASQPTRFADNTFASRQISKIVQEHIVKTSDAVLIPAEQLLNATTDQITSVPVPVPQVTYSQGTPPMMRAYPTETPKIIQECPPPGMPRNPSQQTYRAFQQIGNAPPKHKASSPLPYTNPPAAYQPRHSGNVHNQANMIPKAANDYVMNKSPSSSEVTKILTPHGPVPVVSLEKLKSFLDSHPHLKNSLNPNTRPSAASTLPSPADPLQKQQNPKEIYNTNPSTETSQNHEPATAQGDASNAIGTPASNIKVDNTQTDPMKKVTDAEKDFFYLILDQLGMQELWTVNPTIPRPSIPVPEDGQILIPIYADDFPNLNKKNSNQPSDNTTTSNTNEQKIRQEGNINNIPSESIGFNDVIQMITKVSRDGQQQIIESASKSEAMVTSKTQSKHETMIPETEKVTEVKTTEIQTKGAVSASEDKSQDQAKTTSEKRWSVVSQSDNSQSNNGNNAEGPLKLKLKCSQFPQKRKRGRPKGSGNKRVYSDSDEEREPHLCQFCDFTDKRRSVVMQHIKEDHFAKFSTPQKKSPPKSKLGINRRNSFSGSSTSQPSVVLNRQLSENAVREPSFKSNVVQSNDVTENYDVHTEAALDKSISAETSEIHTAKPLPSPVTSTSATIPQVQSTAKDSKEGHTLKIQETQKSKSGANVNDKQEVNDTMTCDPGVKVSVVDTDRADKQSNTASDPKTADVSDSTVSDGKGDAQINQSTSPELQDSVENISETNMSSGESSIHESCRDNPVSVEESDSVVPCENNKPELPKGNTDDDESNIPCDTSQEIELDSSHHTTADTSSTTLLSEDAGEGTSNNPKDAILDTQIAQDNSKAAEEKNDEELCQTEVQDMNDTQLESTDTPLGTHEADDRVDGIDITPQDVTTAQVDSGGTDGDHECKRCGQRFLTPETLFTHCKVMHSNTKGLKLCYNCGYTTRVSSILQRHIIKWHSKTSKHTCTSKSCRKVFSTAEELKQHMSEHFGKRKYKCRLCGVSYHYINGLRAHQIRHTYDYPFKCGQCGLKFKTKGMLERHEFQRKHFSG